MKRFIFILIAVVSIHCLNFAQITISGAIGINGNYNSLTKVGGVFAAINSSTQTAANILITINTDISTEDGSVSLNSGQWNSLIILPEGMREISGNVNGALINLNGAQHVIIDGLNSVGNTLIISNSATASSSTLRFINDASNNIIRNCTLLGSETSASSGVVYFSTGSSTGNDGNTVSHCKIGPDGINSPVNGIYSTGTSSSIDNSGNTLDANNIYDFFNPGIASAGINCNGTGNSGWIITNNKIYQSTTKIYSSGNTHCGIIIGGGSGYTLTGNCIGYSNPEGGGTMNLVGNSTALNGSFPTNYTTAGTANATRFIGISCAFTNGGPVSNIQGNIIGGIALFTSSSASTTNGILCGISISSGNVNIGTISGNTIGSPIQTSSLYACTTNAGGTVVGIYSNSANTVSIQNNMIGGIDAVGSNTNLSGGFTGIDVRGAGMFSISSNSIGNTSNDNIRCGYTNTSGSLSISGNLSSTTGTTSALTGIRSASTGTSLSVTSNILRGWVSSATGGGNLNGIACIGGNTVAVVIDNNSIGTAPLGWMRYAFPNSGIVTGISMSGSVAAIRHSIQNNDFQGIVYSQGGSGSHTYISTTAGVAPNDTTIINGNSFTNLDVNSSGSVTFISHNYAVSASGTQIIDNNSIVGSFIKSSAGGTLTLATSSANSANGAIIHHHNNNFSYITVIGATSIAGWSDSDGGGSSKSFSGNIFDHWTGGANSLTVFNLGNGGSNTTEIYNNRISNITTLGSATGMLAGPSGNLINIHHNCIAGITSSGSSALVIGLSITGGSSVNVYNNMIGKLEASNSSSEDAIRGISITSVSPSTSYNVFYNSVYLNSSSSGGNFGSSGIYHTSSNSPFTALLELRNNIIVNVSDHSGTGMSVAFRRSDGSAGMLSNYSDSSNYNLFYAGVPGPSNLIYSDGVSMIQTLPFYKAGIYEAGTIAPRDAASVTENPPFLNTLPGSLDFLHLNTAIATQCESGGSQNTPIAVNTDFDGDLRQGQAGYTGNGSAPDIGADEFNGMSQVIVSLSGNIKYFSTAAPNMNAVSLTLRQAGSDLQSTVTDANGNYLFSNVCPGTYEVVLSKDPYLSGGVNATDAAQVNYFGVHSNWSGPWPLCPLEKVRMYAGDVVTTNRLESADAARILQFFVQNFTPSWGTRASWTFWPCNDLLTSNPSSSFTSVVMPTINVGTEPLVINFWALSTGDFNRSFVANLQKKPSETVHLYSETLRKMDEGTEADLPVYSKSDHEISAISLIFNLPNEDIRVNDIIVNPRLEGDFSYAILGNELRIGWYSNNPVLIKAGESLFNLKVKATKPCSDNESWGLTLAADPLNEIADGDYKVIPTGELCCDNLIILPSLSSTVNSSLTISCHPNPFQEDLYISYTLPENGNLKITLTNILGETIKTWINEDQQEGLQHLVLLPKTLIPGVYLLNLRLETPKQVFNKSIKIVRN